MKKVLRAYKKTVSIVNETAIWMYENLGSDRVGFLMESNEKESGKYTFMGVDPQALVQSQKDGLVITENNGNVTKLKGNPLVLLKEYFSSFEVHSDETQDEFNGGLVGSLGYDFIRYTENLPDDNEDEIGIETIQLMLALKFIAIDHMAETVTAVVLDEDNEKGKKRALAEAEKLIDEARTPGNENKKSCEIKNHHDGVIIKKSDTLEQYSEKVNKIKEYIKEGHIFQTVLSQRWTIQTKQTGFDLYKQLRVLNPSPYLYYYNFGKFEIIGSSPEMIVKQTGNNVYTCPIAGTRKRGKTKEEDEALERELLSDEKEKAEHVMLVDLARNDLSRNCHDVRVVFYKEPQYYSHVIHLVSRVSGMLNEGANKIKTFIDTFPAGTLSGAPKVRAMQLISEIEPHNRGAYGGCIGFIGLNGELNQAITIRTFVSRNNELWFQAGGGIVARSQDEYELQEVNNKLGALKKAIDLAVKLKN